MKKKTPKSALFIDDVRIAKLERKLHFANKCIERLKRHIESETACHDGLRKDYNGVKGQLERSRCDVEAVRQSNKGLAEKTIAQAARIEHLEGELSRLTADWAGECRAKESLQTKLKELFDLKEGSLGQWGADDLRRQLQESKNRESVVLNALDEEKKRSDELATARDLFYQKNGEAIRTICKLESENAQLIETGNAATEQLAELHAKNEALRIAVLKGADVVGALEKLVGTIICPGDFTNPLVKMKGGKLSIRAASDQVWRDAEIETWLAAFDAFSNYEEQALSQKVYEALFTELEAAYNAAAVCDQPNYAHCLVMLRKAYETTN